MQAAFTTGPAAAAPSATILVHIHTHTFRVTKQPRLCCTMHAAHHTSCTLNTRYSCIYYTHCVVLNCTRSLEVLRLDGNALMGLPSGLSALTSLRELHAANNKLQQLPRVMEPLQKLEVLQVGRSSGSWGGIDQSSAAAGQETGAGGRR